MPWSHSGLGQEGTELAWHMCILSDWIACVSNQVEHLHGHKSYLNFSFLMWYVRQAHIHLGEIYFNGSSLLIVLFVHLRGIIKHTRLTVILSYHFLLDSQYHIHRSWFQTPTLAPPILSFSFVIPVKERSSVSSTMAAQMHLKLFRECSIL